jgi:hypothetical protein
MISGIGVGELIIITPLATGYIVPSIVAHLRKHQDKKMILIVNLTLGWTIVGWFAVFFWALTNAIPKPPENGANEVKTENDKQAPRTKNPEVNEDSYKSDLKTHNTKEITAKVLFRVFGVIIGISFFILGIAFIISSRFLSGILMIVVAITLMPPLYERIEKLFHIRLSKGVKILLQVLLLIGIAYSSGNQGKKRAPTQKDNAKPTITESKPEKISSNSVTVKEKPLDTQKKQPKRSTNFILEGQILEEAVLKVKHSDDFSKSVEPYAKELDWYGVGHEDKTWIIGLFESPWGVKFIRDASIWDDRVYAYTSRSTRPNSVWIKKVAKEKWNLETFFTKIPPDYALEVITRADKVRYALKKKTILDSYSELMADDSITQKWRFAFYVENPDGERSVLVVGGFKDGVKEGKYQSEYGFGNAADAFYDIPLKYQDWVHSIAVERNWTDATNLKK